AKDSVARCPSPGVLAKSKISWGGRSWACAEDRSDPIRHWVSEDRRPGVLAKSKISWGGRPGVLAKSKISWGGRPGVLAKSKISWGGRPGVLAKSKISWGGRSWAAGSRGPQEIAVVGCEFSGVGSRGPQEIAVVGCEFSGVGWGAWASKIRRQFGINHLGPG